MSAFHLLTIEDHDATINVSDVEEKVAQLPPIYSNGGIWADEVDVEQGFTIVKRKERKY